MADGKSIVIGTAPSAESYQEAALAALEGGGGAPAETPALEASKPAVVPHVVEDDEPSLEAKVAEAEGKKEEPAKEPEKKEPPSRLERSFEKLVAEQTQVRQERQALETKAKELESRVAKYSRLEEAISKKDGLALLAAAGLSYKQLANQLLDGSLPDEETVVEKKDQGELAQRLERLERELSQRRAADGRAKLTDQIKEVAKSDRFSHVSALGEEAQARALLEDYVTQHGKLPAEDLEASIELALEVTEQKLRKEAEKFRKLSGGLTKSDSTGTVSSSKAAVPPSEAVSDRASKTLSNSAIAAPRSLATHETHQLRDQEDYLRDALALLTQS